MNVKNGSRSNNESSMSNRNLPVAGNQAGESAAANYKRPEFITLEELSKMRALPTKAELDQLLWHWSQSGMPLPREKTVLDFIREHVQRQPKAIAVQDGDQLMDFATLDRLSNRVANRLLRAGLKREGIVALALNRSSAYVVAALGVLKAGGTYLPLDLCTPDHLLKWLLEDSGAKMAFTHPDEVDRFKEWDGLMLAIGDGAETLAKESDVPVTVTVVPSQRAYVIYTSGSTGKPKGVEIEHHSLTNLVTVYKQWLGLTPEDRGTVMANVAFDASVIDLWPMLCAGGSVLIAPKELGIDLDGLIRWFAAEKVTYSFVATALAEVLLTRPWPKDISLRFLCTGGDTLHIQPPTGLPFHLINAYGPTENTVVSTWSIIAPGASNQQPTIGRALGNVKTYVLNEERQPVSAGEEGELFVGGEQVARGYLNREELTREKFLPDPFSSVAGARMYATGDWVRLRADGELDFLGRRDSQVQIRGRRVELGQIEQQLHGHPSVSQACCVPVMDGRSVTGVMAHIVATNQELKLADTLRDYLADRLPPFMIPTGFIFHERLPLTSRGKVDRTALSQCAKTTSLTKFEADLPAGSKERAIARLWFELLPNAGDAATHATFEELGGDSLHAIKLLLGVESIIGRRIAHSTFLMDPTLPGLLRTAATPANTVEEEQLIVLRQGGSRPPIFCLYGLHGDISHYLELAKALGDDQPVFAIRSLGLNDPSKLPQTMEEAAARAVKLIEEAHPHQTPVLIGYSWAGYLAFEVARQWLAKKGTAPFLAMVGTPGLRRPTSAAYRVWHFIRWFPAWVIEKLRDGSDRSFRQMMTRFFRFFVKDPVEKKTEFQQAEWASPPIVTHFLAIADKYHPTKKQPIEIHLFRETLSQGRIATHPLESSRTDQLPDCGWQYWTKCPVHVHWLETDHDAILHAPEVNRLATRVHKLINRYYTSALLGWWGIIEHEISLF